MALNTTEILETFVDKISRNSEIMQIMKLPTILDTDTTETKKIKRRTLIDKVISKTSQEPYELGKKFPEVTIDGVTYSDYGDIRMTVSLAQSIKISNALFSKPQVDINIYYDNTKYMETIFKLLDLISDLFSGQTLIVDIGGGKKMLKDLTCEVITSQVAIINNYERVGIRFSFYSTVYKIL